MEHDVSTFDTREVAGQLQRAGLGTFDQDMTCVKSTLELFQHEWNASDAAYIGLKARHNSINSGYTGCKSGLFQHPKQVILEPN